MNAYVLKNGESLIVREAKSTDAEAVLVHMKSVGDESDTLTFDSTEITRGKEEQAKLIQESSEAENKIFLVATIDDEMVGVMNVHAVNRARLKHVGEFGISVRKAHWQKGIALHMMNYMLQWAKENPVIRKINLRVLKHNIPAIQMYKKLGFEEEGVLRRDFFLNGKFYDCQLMGKFID